MYAIVEVGGRQWKVEPGTRLAINRIAGAVGSQHAVERVLLACDGAQVQVGRPHVQGVKVVCVVLAHSLGPKTISYHFRRRENWRKTVGHRQPLTQLLVKDILIGTERPAEKATLKAAGSAPKTSAAAPRKSASRPTPAAARIPRPRKAARPSGGRS